MGWPEAVMWIGVSASGAFAIYAFFKSAGGGWNK